MTLPNVKRYSGFTLIEMMIVVAIMIILFAIGLTSFGGMRDSILISENYNNLSQDIRWAQKSSILLKRELNEYWPYGIGLDVRNLTVDGTYKFFKWCSPFKDFDPNGDIRMNSELPNFNPNLALGGPTNGYLPPVLNTGCNMCGATCTNTLVEVKGRITTKTDRNIVVKKGSAGINVGFVFFEAVTGRAFLYDNGGVLLNYSSSGTALVYNPTGVLEQFDIQLQPKDSNYGLAKRLNMQPVSGKITDAPVIIGL